MGGKSLEDMKRYFQEVTEELLMMREIDNLEMYRVITDKGKELEGISEAERTDENFVYGCISNVYIVGEFLDGVMHYRGASEAHVVRGLLTYLIEALNGLAPGDIVTGTRDAVEEFADAVDLKSTLTPNRANAFGNIYKLMVEKAAAHVDGT